MTIYELTQAFTTEASHVSVFDVDSMERLWETTDYSEFLALSSIDDAEIMSIDVNVIKDTLGYSLDIYLEDAYEYFDDVKTEDNSVDEDWDEEDEEDWDFFSIFDEED